MKDGAKNKEIIKKYHTVTLSKLLVLLLDFATK